MSIQQSINETEPNQKRRVRVLVVDDSALVREILTRGLSQDPEIEVVGSASNPFIARDKIVELRPDVLTLDVEMPRMDGVEFLRRLMPQYPIPVLIVSALTEKGKQITMDALEAGAVDFVTKPSVDVSRGLTSMLDDLRAKVKIASRANVKSWKKKTKKSVQPSKFRNRALSESTDKVIAIGASTGGTEAIRRIVTCLPADFPGVVVVLHMPAGFTKMYADRLNQECDMIVKEAADGDRVMMGRILVAPGDFHMEVRRSGGQYYVRCHQGEKVNRHRPSVDALFNSVAVHVGSNAIGVICTGMGADGAQGLLTMKNTGAKTLAQDAITSVVFGMPKVAYQIGAVTELYSIDEIAGEIMNLLTEKN